MTGRTFSISDATVSHGDTMIATGQNIVVIFADSGDETELSEQIDVRELFKGAMKELKEEFVRPLCNAFDWQKQRARERWHVSPVVAWIARALTHGQK